MNVQLHRALFADAPTDPLARHHAIEHSRGRSVLHLDDRLPHVVTDMKSRFEGIALWTPNACMANVYQQGSRVGWHIDSDVLRLGIVSLGGDAEFGYAETDVDPWDIESGHYTPETHAQLTLRHGDLLLFNDAERAAHTVRNLADRTSFVFRQYRDGHWSSTPIW